MSRVGGEQGFTLIELLVTMAITVVVFGATLAAFEVFQSNNRFDLLRSEGQDNARNAMDRFARELRNVAAPGIGSAGALERVAPYSITFQTISATEPKPGSLNSTNAMRVRYCLDDSTPSNEVLWRQTQTWTNSGEAPAIPGEGSCPNPGWESSIRLAPYVTNRNGGQTRRVFTYGPASAGEEVAKIVSIEMNLLLDVNPGQRRPGESQLTSGISLRNANRLPVARFTATELNGRVKLNASESTDPDGLALAYKWWQDGTQLSTTSQEYQTLELKSKTVHTFKLEVTDPGGLKSEAPTQTVEIK
jgi:prepilin-type N-terminal cleavage/methylation domain-containing protein